MIVFSLLNAVLALAIPAFLPGMLVSFGLFRKSEFSIVEKAIIGCAIGWMGIAFTPFMLFMLLGVPFSYGIALASSAVLFIAGILSMYFSKAYTDAIEWAQRMKSEAFAPKKDIAEFVKTHYVSALVLALFFLSFWVRVQTITPIYEELDPYFYLYSVQQVLTLGSAQLTDTTAWYTTINPVTTGHRTVPFMEYLDATLYSFYTGGGAYDNYLLSNVAALYPPIAGAFLFFFVYLAIRAYYRPEYGIIAGVLASFAPILIMKLLAGVTEIQPYAFFAVPFFLAFFAWSARKNEWLYYVFAGIGYMATCMGSSSEIVVATIFLLASWGHAALMYISGKKLDNYLKFSAAMFAFIAFSVVAKVYYTTGTFGISSRLVSGLIALAGPALFFAIDYLSKSAGEAPKWLPKALSDYIPKLRAGASRLLPQSIEGRIYALGAFAVLGLFVLFFTPVGTFVRNFGSDALQIAEFVVPLQRTIAEQNTSGTVFEPYLGFMGKIFDHGIYVYIGIAAWLFSLAANVMFSVFASALNFLLGTTINYDFKENSVLMVLLLFSAILSVFSIWREYFSPEKEKSPGIRGMLFLAVLFPVAIIGLLKAKYVIYLGLMLAFSAGLVLGELEAAIIALGKMAGGSDWAKNAALALIILGMVCAYMQIIDENSPAVAMLLKSTTPRFQDDPMALQARLSAVCNQTKAGGGTGNADICAAAADPLGYADKGTNYQYSQQMCYISLINDPFTGNDPNQAGVAYRCQRLSEYWIESMEWIRNSTPAGSRITSWWDYGHWINYFGQRNAVIRNEHASTYMIGEVANAYIMGTPEQLKQAMVQFNSSYALFDAELLLSGNSFGGKYGALNYLACARNNQTDVTETPGTSECESKNLWTQALIPENPSSAERCSVSLDKSGVIAYAYTASGLAPKYCAAAGAILGRNATLLYDLDNRTASGELRLHRALLRGDGNVTGQGKVYDMVTLMYFKDPIWPSDDGTGLVSGWDDRTSNFYDSTLYQAFILENLPGFTLEYKTSDGMVKIYKMN
jgi:hypothetical protein